MVPRSYYERPAQSTPQTISGPSLAQQHQANDADINTIMQRYQRSGVLPSIKQKQPIFADVTSIGDFRDMQDKIISATDAFNELPSRLRERFHNSPAEIIDFCLDADNKSEAIKLGLIPEPIITPVAVAPEKADQAKIEPAK